MFSSLVVLLLDDMSNKGYGVRPATSMFIATNVCENIMWSIFAPTSAKVGNRSEYFGALLALFHSFFSTEDRMGAF